MEKGLYNEVLLSGNSTKLKELIEAALQAGDAPQQIIKQALIPAMEKVGEKFKANEIFLPEVMLAARVMQSGLAVLKPLLTGEPMDNVGSVVIGTVQGDHHDIGKNLVAMMLEGAGFKVIDLGADVSAERFLQAWRQHQPQIIGMSSLLTTTMPKMKEVIDRLVDAGVRAQVKVLIGGAPVTQEYAERIGADGYAPDAGAAVEVAKQLL
ncbi:MAG: cobalamin-binding protein [Firmicutes bacterium]|nr:cobalamin-binding protein [Bacillota bacterium]